MLKQNSARATKNAELSQGCKILVGHELLSIL